MSIVANAVTSPALRYVPRGEAEIVGKGRER